ncbi:ABC-type sugar transport system, ATPase component [Pseudoxanthobacter soli DSM 19599]|uniref:ABC-type sugar transport system, ATPase component n=2 Tax=Pseudoxanthobacter TaxID=433838 RepID=A0A1M7ZKQ6_9HYPH|nr:ABC transporter ATP-binding protein [Pseudoxanthobacter soli]SHO65490.1 ABC-type sugar transport system, ATPase component [Pseudoxanthobacter soli DSM 19599]
MISFLHLRTVSAGYGATRILHGLDLDVAQGEFVALLGASGCGKTTLLRTIAGFTPATAGSISVGGVDVTALSPDRRGMAMVFQSYALWPHMTVARNIGYGLKLRGRSRAEITRRVDEMLDMLGLAGLGERKPAALSGGQRQRVALGRALAIDPKILLLDEPLSNLDARIRVQLRGEIRALQQRLGITAIHVTHDREEAMAMADRIVILDGGNIVQQGSPQQVYNAPASSFVAAFMGAENSVRLSGRTETDLVTIEPGAANPASVVALAGRAPLNGPLEARFRAGGAALAATSGHTQQPAQGLQLTGTVLSVGYPGGAWRHRIAIGGEAVEVDAPQPFSAGETVRVFVPPENLFLFAASGAASPPNRHRPMAAA